MHRTIGECSGCACAWRTRWQRQSACTAEAVEDLRFSLQQEQRAALQTMALVMDRARRAPAQDLIQPLVAELVVESP